MGGMFIVALLEDFDDLVRSVGSAYSVLVWSGCFVYLLFVGLVDRGGGEAAECGADAQWSQAVVDLDLGG